MTPMLVAKHLISQISHNPRVLRRTLIVQVCVLLWRTTLSHKVPLLLVEFFESQCFPAHRNQGNLTRPRHGCVRCHTRASVSKLSYLGYHNFAKEKGGVCVAHVCKGPARNDTFWNKVTLVRSTRQQSLALPRVRAISC